MNTSASLPASREPPLGVVIPTLNEEDTLPGLLEDLRSLAVPARIVVVDGGSSDGTLEACRRGDVQVVVSAPGRSRQMQAGARTLETPWLLFLHADSRLPPEARTALARVMAEPPHEEAAIFRFRLDADGWWWRLIELGQRLRERVTGLAYGDQGLLVSRSRLDAVGGVPDLPLMEDVELVRRLRRSRGVHRIPAPLFTSARRYREEGPVRGWLRNASLITLYCLGVSARRLAAWYPPHARTGGGRDARAGRLLLVFAKDPQPGRVKTRLAEALGAQGAARLYRRMGRIVVDRVRTGAYRVVVCYDPPGSAARVARWLGDGADLEYRAQSGGGLGERLEEAFGWGFREAERVVVIGTDAPGVDEELVEEAFSALDGPGSSDVVLGPAEDGGYYLLGLRRPAARLFRGISWSTPQVLDETVARSREMGLGCRFLRPLADVDRPEDVPAQLRTSSGPG